MPHLTDEATWSTLDFIAGLPNGIGPGLHQHSTQGEISHASAELRSSFPIGSGSKFAGEMDCGSHWLMARRRFNANSPLQP